MKVQSSLKSLESHLLLPWCPKIGIFHTGLWCEFCIATLCLLTMKLRWYKIYIVKTALQAEICAASCKKCEADLEGIIRSWCHKDKLKISHHKLEQFEKTSWMSLHENIKLEQFEKTSWMSLLKILLVTASRELLFLIYLK